MMILCLCCGKEFNISPSRYGKKKYCSMECRRKNENNLSVIISCGTCGKQFKKYLHETHKKYCSKRCSDMAQIEKPKVLICKICGEHYTSCRSQTSMYCSKKCAGVSFHRRITKPCYICGAPITRPSSLFKNNCVCSKECRSEYSRRCATGPNSPVFNSDFCQCLQCGKEYYMPRSRTMIGKGKFCSRSCKGIYLKEHCEEGRRGTVFYHGPNWRTQRALTLERDNYECQQCGTKRRLAVHHIIPYRVFQGDYLRANQLGNLITLCVSCHSKQKSHHCGEFDNLLYGNTVITAIGQR